MGLQTISVVARERWQDDPEYRGKQSALAKQRWQNPEYRAKQTATHAGRHHTGETRAKLSAVLRRWHNKRGAG